MTQILNDQSCPACGSQKCVFGRLDLGDSDTKVDGSFHPENIKMAMIVRARPSSKVLNDQYFHACSECGLLWSKVDKTELISSLKEHDWLPGQPQYKAKSAITAIKWFLASVIVGLVGAIWFFSAHA